MLTQAQLEMRQKGVTATDAAKLCDTVEGQGAYDVFLDKVTPLEQKPDVDNKFMRRGRRLEPYIAGNYSEITGLELADPAKTFQHADHPWMMATPDRFSMTQDGAWKRVVECKSARWTQRYYYGEPGSSDVPLHYLIQVAYQQMVCGGLVQDQVADLAVQFGLEIDDCEIFPIPRDAELEGFIEEAVGRFYKDHLEPFLRDGTLKPPAQVSGSERASKALEAMYPAKEKNVLEVGGEYLAMIRSLHDAEQSAKQTERDKATAQNQLKALMGELGVTGIKGEWGKIYWSAVKKEQVDWEQLALALRDAAVMEPAHYQAALDAHAIRQVDWKGVVEDLLDAEVGHRLPPEQTQALRAEHTTDKSYRRFVPYWAKEWFEQEGEETEDGQAEAGE